MRTRLGIVAGALVLLVLARLLPGHEVGLYLRLAAATAVLLVPGALIAGGNGSAMLAWSLGALFAAMAVTFSVHGSLTLALVILAAIAVAAVFVPHENAPPVPWAWAVALAGVAFGVVLWRVSGPVDGDALFHLARVRKLEAFGSLSLHRVGEFRDGGLHPGYAFPLWHAFLALVSRLAGVDPGDAVRHESSVLCPVAFVVVFEAGTAAFRRASLGLAVLVAEVGLLGLAPGHGGSFRSLDLPATTARLLLGFAALGLFFRVLDSPGWRTALPLAWMGLARALVHPTYARFVLIPLLGFAAVSVLVSRRASWGLGIALAAFTAPMLLAYAWLYPVVKQTASHNPSLAEVARALKKYGNQIDVYSLHSYRLAPEVIARSGTVAVAGLALIPLAAFGARRRWGAFVLGGSLAVLALMLTSQLFVPFSDLVSLSQSRRAAGFIPFAFAFVGGVGVLAAWLRWAVLPVALAAGVVLERKYPGDFGYVLHGGGPSWAVWIGAAGGAVALLVAILWRGLPEVTLRGRLAAGAAALFVLPVAVHGFANWTPPKTGKALPAGLVSALRTKVPKGAVVFSDLDTSYRIGAAAPLYVAANPPAHVADVKANHPYRRAADVATFLRTGSLAIPRRYGAGWLVIDRKVTRLRPNQPVVWTNGRYTLYRL
ncbi:MAG TPA: hypothetical protein VMT59_09930 [Gaiellaceae bacterium]|nr:hypothetical protein [Gaiellaceae bacterium]